MKKLYGLLVMAFILNACLPAPAPSAGDSAPNVDTNATIDALVKFAAAQTLAALPSPTSQPTSEPASTLTETPVVNGTTTTSPTPVPNLTTTPVTATSGTEIIATSTPPTNTGITSTPTLGILKYGTLPPAVAFSQITLVNKSKVQAYISLQNCPPDRTWTILEYPVKKEVKVNAPLGPYMYVAWIGGRQFTGSFKLSKNQELTITLYKDKITIQ